MVSWELTKVNCPTSGLSKELRDSFQDQVLIKLQNENANPRFHKRLASSLARFLNRALSEKPNRLLHSDFIA